MSKYFKKDFIDIIDSENIRSVLKRADKHPENFIRITINQDIMKLKVHTKAEFEIWDATVFHFLSDGNIYRFDISPGNPDQYLYAAADYNNFMAVAWGDSKTSFEKLFMFDSCEILLIIVKTDNSTAFLLYDGNADKNGYGFYLESEGYPSIYPVLMHLLEISQPSQKEEDKTEAEN